MKVNLKGLIGRLNDTCRSALEGAAGLCLSVLMYRLLGDELSPLMLSIVILLTASVTIGLPVWHHGMRKRLSGWVMAELIKKP